MWLVRCLSVLVTIQLSLSCPSQCRCSLDGRGRRKVQCTSGGIMDPIPVQEMEADTQVLQILGSRMNRNSLTLGPIFRGLRKLEEIHIVWSAIPALGDHSLWGLHRLYTLNLTHNRIESLRSSNFRGAKSIRHLDLSHNEIESIPSAVFHAVPNIQTLTLAHNTIPELTPRIFFGLNLLTQLDLSYNPLGDLLPERFADIPELTTFACCGCGLMTISTSLLEKMAKVTHLDLRDNRLTQVPHNINILKRLAVLKLNGNHISFIEKGIISGSSLTRLSLSHNRIIRIEQDAFVNTSLNHLDISYNRLTHLEPGSMDGVIHQLTDIRISGNSLHIDHIKSLIPKAKRLRHLGLGDMGLTVIPANLLRHSKHLHHLNVSANYLQKLPVDLPASTSHLHVLDISLNSFRGLDEEFMKYLANVKHLRVLKLEGNPWYCDTCHIQPLLRWLQSAPDQESGCRDSRVWTCLKCIGPKGFSGTALSLLPLGDIPQCTSTTLVRPTWLGPTMTNVIGSTRPIVPQADDPRLPRGPLTLQEQEWTFQRFIEEQLVLVLISFFAILILVLIIVTIIIVAYNKHSAYYYTYEDDPEKKEKLVLSKNGKNNNSTYEATPRKSTPTIATIDEVKNIAGSHEVLEPEKDQILELEREPRPGSNPDSEQELE